RAHDRHDAHRPRLRCPRGARDRPVAVSRRGGHWPGEGIPARRAHRRQRGAFQLRRHARLAAHRRYGPGRRPVHRIADSRDRPRRRRGQGPHARLPRRQGAEGEEGVSKPRYRALPLGGSLEADFVRRDDGSTLVVSREALRPYPKRLTDRFLHWAEAAPDRTLVAKRVKGGEWRRVSYAEALKSARAIAQALLDRGVSVERPVAILSDNDIEHLLLALGAMFAGVPYASVSPAYSLISQDYGKLRHILDLLTPGLVFASGPAYAKAIAAVVPAGTPVVLTEGAIDGRTTVPFASLLQTVPTAAVDAAYAKVGPDTIAKFLFTSGSTKLPKGVINTQRMLCANQQMIGQCFPALAAEPPVLVDWLPWNHTFGGNHNIGITLYNGGTLYIDEGKPTPALIGETLRNLREIAPTIYFNVPKGFEEIANA